MDLQNILPHFYGHIGLSDQQLKLLEKLVKHYETFKFGFYRICIFFISVKRLLGALIFNGDF